MLLFLCPRDRCAGRLKMSFVSNSFFCMLKCFCHAFLCLFLFALQYFFMSDFCLRLLCSIFLFLFDATVAMTNVFRTPLTKHENVQRSSEPAAWFAPCARSAVFFSCCCGVFVPPEALWGEKEIAIAPVFQCKKWFLSLFRQKDVVPSS